MRRPSWSEPSPASQRLRRFFLWITRRTFQDLHIDDQEMADYLSDMLTDFAKTDRLFEMRDAEGAPMASVVEMLCSHLPGESDLQKERDFFQYLGDYLLFMSGLFREYTEARGFLQYYMVEGPRAYRKVWEVEKGMFRPTARLFERLWRSFEFHAGALHYMRKTFFRDFRGGDTPGDWRRRVILLATDGGAS